MKTLLAKHRSIRKFRSEPIAPEVLQDMLEAASRASTCGNMQLYSLIVTQSRELREALAPCHFNQPMVTQAPCVITVCADVHRFSMWCEQRDAEPCYDNFAWFLNGVTDALLAAQNLCVEAEAHGLGICYLGTTIYTAEEIARIENFAEEIANEKMTGQLYTTGVPYSPEKIRSSCRSMRSCIARNTIITPRRRSTNSGPRRRRRKRPGGCSRRTACRIWHRFSRATGIVPKITWLFRATISRC